MPFCVRLETKFLYLKKPVTLGSRFDDWEVCWVGGWSKRRFGFVVMLVRVIPKRTIRNLRLVPSSR
jgi:hypothetical protein